MFKIGDFSKLGQVSTRMLRHYDKLGLLVPDQTDEWTGYRYYSIQQLSRLHRIIALKDLGLSLQQISELLDKEDDELPAEQLRGMLTLKRRELEKEKREMEERLLQVEARLRQLEHENEPSPYETLVKSVPALRAALLSQKVPHVSEMGYFCDSMTNSLYRQLKEAKLSWIGPEMILYYSDEYKESDLFIEVCVGIADNLSLPEDADLGFEVNQYPAYDQVASLIYEGEFSEMSAAVFELLRWIGTHNHVPDGPLREIHLSGPAHPEKPTGILPVVELQLPIKRLEK